MSKAKYEAAMRMLKDYLRCQTLEVLNLEEFLQTL